MIFQLLILSTVLSVPQPGVPEENTGPLYHPCWERVDNPGDMGGGVFRTGIYDCDFRLTDPEHAAGERLVRFTFKRNAIVPLDDDLADLKKLKNLPETPDGIHSRPSLRLGGDFASRRKPRFEGEAEFIAMPIWNDAAAQEAASPGADWPAVAGSEGLRCTQVPDIRCRFIARRDDIFVAAYFEPRREPLETTTAALSAYVADW